MPGKKTTAKKKAKTTTFVELLKRDHREVEEIFEKICGKKAKKNLAQKESTFKDLRHALTIHSDAEERILYPRIEDIEELKHIAFESYEEHALVRRLLGELDASDSNTDEWIGKITVLKELVEHHVEEEENEMFPKLKKALDKNEMSKLTEEIRQFKESEGTEDSKHRRYPSPELEREIRPQT
jgi:hemerythrin superfamily protein